MEDILGMGEEILWGGREKRWMKERVDLKCTYVGRWVRDRCRCVYSCSLAFVFGLSAHIICLCAWESVSNCGCTVCM
jgi:hypothetical protein